MAASKQYALVRVKAGGRFYEPGDEIPTQDDNDALVEAGVVGPKSKVDKLEKANEEQATTIEELQAQVADLTAQLEASQLALAQAQENTESVTDAEAKAAADADAAKIGN